MRAWQFDRAVATFGMAVDNDIRAAKDKAKTKNQIRLKVNQVLIQYDLIDPGKAFRDPVKG